MTNKELIKKIIKKVLKEDVGYFKNNESIPTDNIIFIDTVNDFNKYAAKVWEILTLSYENIGGLKTYKNYNDFLKKRHYVRIVFNQNNEIIACATYRRIQDSFKMVAIGCNQEEDGKIGLQQIIKYDINNLELHCWAEVSGAIEHYFKKHNGYPMPNTLASTILEIPESQITLSDKDNVHYDRPIGENHELYTKMIFGIKSKEIYQKAIAEVENYGKFMEEVNQSETLTESPCRYNLKQAMYIIDNIYRAHEEDGFNELIPSWHRALVESLKTLKHSNLNNKAVQDYIRYCEYLLNDMQLLELHYF